MPDSKMTKEIRIIFNLREAVYYARAQGIDEHIAFIAIPAIIDVLFHVTPFVDMMHIWHRRDEIIEPNGYSHVYEHLTELFSDVEELFNDPQSFNTAVDVLMHSAIFCIEGIISVITQQPELMNDPIINKTIVNRDHIYDCHVEAQDSDDAYITLEFEQDDRS